MPLLKGCPMCGGSINASIEITDIDALTCPSCFNKYAEYKSPADLVTKLFQVTEYDPKRTRSFDDMGYITAMDGAYSIFRTEKAVSVLKDYLDTGIRPEGAIVSQKGQKAQYSLSELVFELIEGEVPKRNKRAKLIDLIEKLETTGDTHDRAKAVLVRSLLNNWNPSRLGIRPLKEVSMDIQKALKLTKVPDAEMLTKVIFRQYLKDMYIKLIELFEDHPQDSLLLLSHEKLLPDIRYGIMILEEENYHIYLFR